jgi:hypothetical protein
MICGKCGRQLHRVSRNGVAERVLLPRLGVYPFGCRRCSVRIYACGRDTAANVQGLRSEVLAHFKKWRLLPKNMADAPSRPAGELYQPPVPLEFYLLQRRNKAYISELYRVQTVDLEANIIRDQACLHASI